MGLDVNYKRKGGLGNDSKVFGLSNQVNTMSLGEVFWEEGWAGLQWRGG